MSERKQTDIVKKELTKIVKILAISYKPKQVVVFGSSVKGKRHKDSDLDILVVKEGVDSISRQERFLAVSSLLPHNLPLDILVYTPYEIKKRLYLGDPFIKNIFSEGKIVYDS